MTVWADGYALTLVHAWLLQHPTYYCSFVRAYTQYRWSAKDRRVHAIQVHGHWRHAPDWAMVLPALRCSCKLETLVSPTVLTAPPSARLMRLDEEGEVIPRKYRVLVFI